MPLKKKKSYQTSLNKSPILKVNNQMELNRHSGRGEASRRRKERERGDGGREWGEQKDRKWGKRKERQREEIYGDIS